MAALKFLQSPMAQEWVEQGRLIETRFPDSGGDELALEHPRVFFPSYPWEWTPSTWMAAADLTLDLCEALLDRGLILKDATPLNVLFRGTEPVFVDVLSIEERDPASPLWLAYAQFVRTFLLPLLAYPTMGWPLSASIQRRDGYEPADLAPYLGRVQRWREPFRSLVTLPLMLEKNPSKGTQKTAEIRQDSGLALKVLQRNLHGLREHLDWVKKSLSANQGSSRWGDYAEGAEHYSGEDKERKGTFVREALTAARPANVLDLGANSGVYSRIAAECGASVVAWDTDVPATEQSWKRAAEQRLPILPLLVNPARPTPAVGWRNGESLALLDRARGRFDGVLMLGFIHHLLLAEQIPLEEVAGLLRELTTQWAIVEWIPPTDPRFKDLLRGRDALYAHLNEAAFLRVMEERFTVVLREELPNRRVLFLLQVR
ncbi:MAG TPA: methyltransferase type 12 [Acidobacteriaceae bacterium]|nr:methyltransferase type 12 [Acidobacteriaceae bacterium]